MKTRQERIEEIATRLMVARLQAKLEADPTEALEKAVRLVDVIDLMADDDAKKAKGLSYSPEHIGISFKAIAQLEMAQIKTVYQLIKYTAHELATFAGIDGVSIREIRRALARRGLCLKGDETASLSEQCKTRDRSPMPKEIGPKTLIEDIGFSARVRNCLASHDICLVSELLERSPKDLLKIKGFGVSSLRVVERKLEKHGLCLRGRNLLEPAKESH